MISLLKVIREQICGLYLAEYFNSDVFNSFYLF